MRTPHRLLAGALFAALPAFAMAQGDPHHVSTEAPQQHELYAEPAATVAPDAFAPLPEAPAEPIGPAILAPSAFTPDGDGLNDKYFPRFVGMDIQRCRFQVFDRWGRVLYTTTTPDDGWDGTMNRAGAAMPQGVYVWLLEAQLPGYEDVVTLAGAVTLVR